MKIVALIIFFFTLLIFSYGQTAVDSTYEHWENTIKDTADKMLLSDPVRSFLKSGFISQDTIIPYTYMMRKFIESFVGYDSLYIFNYFNGSSEPTQNVLLIYMFKDSIVTFKQFDNYFGNFNFIEEKKFNLIPSSVDFTIYEYNKYIKSVGKVFMDGAIFFKFYHNKEFKYLFY